jgi:hypothetical protein
MKAAATVESTANAPANAATCVASAIAASGITADCTAPVTIAAPIAIPRTIAEARAAIEAAAVEAVKPRSGADKDASYKVIRAVIAVGCTSIRVIAIITVCASRSRADTAVNWANSNADAEAHLSLCIAGCKKQNPEQRNIL